VTKTCLWDWGYVQKKLPRKQHHYKTVPVAEWWSWRIHKLPFRYNFHPSSINKWIILYTSNCIYSQTIRATVQLDQANRLGCYSLRPSSPESWYSFYRTTEGRIQPRHTGCEKFVLRFLRSSDQAGSRNASPTLYQLRHRATPLRTDRCRTAVA